MRAAAGETEALTGLWFIGQKYYPRDADSWVEAPDRGIFQALRSWLADYFGGKNPPPEPALAPRGTPFQQTVWGMLREIPYGKTVSYGQIAAQIASASGGKPSAQAVGGAVGHNPLSLLIPCHRVVGASGSLTGYAGGIDKKQALLELERRA
jgi:methylated-DNA-[protein]-cysteine S-methyltransferase